MIHERELLTPEEVADLLRIEARTLRSWRASRTGPAYIKINEGMILYRRADVLAFLEDRTVETNKGEQE